MPGWLVTGAGGFVGANLVRGLLRTSEEVHCIIRPSTSAYRLAGVHDKIRVHWGDITDPGCVDAVLDSCSPRVVVHAAAVGAYSFQRDVVAMSRTNVLGIAQVLGALAMRPEIRLVNLGSSSEYGDLDHAPDEQEPPRPNSAYAATKTAATELSTLARAQGIDAVTLRLYSVYGPLEDPSRLIPALCRAGLERAWPPLTDPAVVRDFVFVDDVVDAIRKAAECRRVLAPVYNVGSGAETSLGGLAAIAKAVFDIPTEPVFGEYPRRDWDTAVWKADPRRMERDLGWSATTTLADGLALTAASLDRS